MNAGDAILFSGGAPGAEAAFGACAERHGIEEVNFTFDGHKIERHREVRLRHVQAYDDAVAGLDGIEPLARDQRDLHALHLYIVRVDPERAGATRDDYQRALTEERIGTSIHFLPVHTLTAYRNRLPDQPSLPVAERAGDEVLSLPLSPAHSEDDIADAIDALQRVHARFTESVS